jgi:alpha-L-fucosidase
MSGEKWRAAELVEMVRHLQPQILIDNRLTAGHEDPQHHAVGFGDFTSPEQIIPAEGVVDREGKPCVWEACITMNDHWGYSRDDHHFKSPAQLVQMLAETVSKGGNLLLNVGPTARGEIPETSVDSMEQVGRWMRRNGESLYGAGPAAIPKPDWGRYTKKGGTLYAHIFTKPVGPIILENLGGKIRRARLLADGSEVDMTKPWNVGPREDHAYLNLAGATLPDDLDTVVALVFEEE